MNTRILTGALALAFVAGGTWFLTRPAPATTDPVLGAAMAQEVDEAAVAEIEIEDMVLGNPDAEVEVIEYASFTCPHCGNFHANQWKDLKANYVDTGKIRFVYREVYFDRPGLWGSMLARCGDSTERFFGIADMIYDQQRELFGSGDPNAMVQGLRTIGLQSGLDAEAVDACLTDVTKAQALVSWYEQNATEDGIRSTPSFVIDGELYSNMSYEDFAAILDEKLGE